MKELDTLITDLEYSIEEMEAGRELRLDSEMIYELDGLEQEIEQQSRYQLSSEDMLKAASMAPVFSDVASSLSYAELEDRLLTAQKERDLPVLYLLSRYAGHEGIRDRASNLGRDTEALGKLERARGLAARLRHLGSMSPAARKRLTLSLGHPAPEPTEQPEPVSLEEKHYQQLRASGAYSL